MQTIVVGSGIIGIACAHYLARDGLQVTVIDRGQIAGGCSHANCGYICPSHLLPLTEPKVLREAIKSLFNPNSPFRVKPRFSPSLWRWMWQFARRCNHRQMLSAAGHLKALLDSSLAEYRRLMADEAFDCQWKQDGLFYVLQTEQGLREFAETDRLLTEQFGLAARRIEGHELPSLDPAIKPGLAGAFHYPLDVSVRPDLLNRQWSQRLGQRGVKFIEHCELHSLDKSAGWVTGLRTSQGLLTADSFVFALGAWSQRWSSELECRIPVEPGKGYSVTCQRPTPAPRYPMLFPEHRVGVSPFEDGCRLGSIMEFAGYDDSIPARRIQQLHDSANQYLVSPLPTGHCQTWFGWRPMTWDSLPIIGPAPRLTNAFLATGHNMLGLSLAAATGRLIAEMITNHPTHLNASPYSPARF